MNEEIVNIFYNSHTTKYLKEKMILYLIIKNMLSNKISPRSAYMQSLPCNV